MRPKVVFLLAICLCSFIGFEYTAASNSYEDLRGRFVVDLPEGWQLQPQEDDRVYVFKKSDDSIIIEFLPNTHDPQKLLQKAVTALNLSGLENPALEGDLKRLAVNGNPALLGLYKGEVAVGKTTVTLLSLLGCVSLGGDGVYFMSIFSPGRRGQLSEPLEKAFASIRTPGQAPTGAREAEIVPAETQAAGPTVWEHECVSLTLPAGWKEKPKLQNFEKEIIGWFEYDRLGCNLLAVCYRGLGMNESKALKAAKQTVEMSIPNVNPAKVYELELGNGKKAPVIVYVGSSVSRGAEVQMAAVTSTFKAGKCYLDLIGFVQSNGLAELERDIVAMTRSAN